MADQDLIQNYIDKASFEADTQFAVEQLSILETAYNKLKASMTSLQSSIGVREVTNNSREASTVLEQLKVKNLELTAAIKQKRLETMAAAEEAKKTAAIAKELAVEEAELSKKAQIAAQEKIAALQKQKQAEEELLSIQKERTSTDLGTYDIEQGSGQSGGAKLKTTTSIAPVERFTPSNDQEASLLLLNKTKDSLAQNLAAQKALNVELKDGNITQAQRDEQLIKLQVSEAEFRKQIQLTNAELKARSNVDSSVQGSIDALTAQNALLKQQRNSIPVGEAASEEDVAKLKSLNAEIDKNNELIDKNNDLLGRQKINIGNYPNAFGGAFKTLNKELDQVQGKLVSGNFGGESVDRLTAKMNVLQGATSLVGKEFSTVGQQQKAYAEASTQIGLVYGKNSDVFKEFAKGVKEGNVNISGLAKEVTNVTSKGKGFLSFLSSAYGGIRKLAYAIPGIGIGGLILLLLGPLQAVGEAFIKWRNNATDAGRATEDLKERMKDLNTVMQEGVKDYGKAVQVVSQLKEEVKLAKEGFLDKDDVLKHYNDTIGETTGHVSTLNDAESDLEKNGDAFIHLMLLKAEAVAAYAEAAKAAQQAVTATANAENDFGAGSLIASNRNKLSFLDKLKSVFLPYDPTLVQHEMDAANDTILETAKKNKDKAEKTFEDFKKMGDQITEEAARWAKEHGFKFFPDPNDTKKGHADSQSLLDEFRKKDLEALTKYSNDNLKILQEYYKEIENDQFASLDDRLHAAQKYYDVSNQLLANQKKADEDALNLEVNSANRKAKGIKDPKLRAETELTIEKYKTDKLKEIDQTFQNGSLKSDQSFYADKVRIANDAFDKIKKESEAAAKFILEQQKIAFQNQKDQIDIDKDNQLLNLSRGFKGGSIKDLEVFNAKKKAIEDAAAIEQKRLDLQKVRDSEKVFEALYGIQNTNFIKQAKDLEVAIELEGNKKILDAQKALLEAKKQLQQQEYGLLNKAIETAQSFVDDSFEKEKERYAKKEKLLEESTKKEIDAINASTLSQQEKVAQEKMIQEASAAQKKQLEDKQKQEDIKKARFDKEISVLQIGISTAEAVAKISAQAAILASNPFTLPAAAVALAQIPFIVGVGALEIAAVLAKPLPAYKMGKTDNYEGFAIVGDGGVSEYIQRGNGSIEKTPSKSTLTYLKKDDIVYPDFLSVMKNIAMPEIKTAKSSQIDETMIVNAIYNGAKMTTQALRKQKGSSLIVNVNTEWASYVRKNVIQ